MDTEGVQRQEPLPIYLTWTVISLLIVCAFVPVHYVRVVVNKKKHESESSKLNPETNLPIDSLIHYTTYLICFPNPKIKESGHLLSAQILNLETDRLWQTNIIKQQRLFILNMRWSLAQVLQCSLIIMLHISSLGALWSQNGREDDALL